MSINFKKLLSETPAPASNDQPWNPRRLGIPDNPNDPWGNFNKVASDFKIPAYTDQQVAATQGSYDPSTDGWTQPQAGEMSTVSGASKALDELIGWRGAAYAQALLENPVFQRRWEQQYPGTINGLYQGLARRNSNWQDNDGALKTAGPALMTLAGAGVGSVLGDATAAAYEGGAHLGGGASTLAGAGATAGAIPSSAAGVGVDGLGSSVGADFSGAAPAGTSGSGVTAGSGPGVDPASGLTSTDLPQGTIPQQQPVNGIDLTTTPQGNVSTAPAGATPGAATPGVTAAATTAATTVGPNVMDRILNGTATAGDWATLAGQLAPGVLGYLGATNQADSFHDLATQYMGMGAPYRQRLSDLYADPTSFMNSKEVQIPVQQGTDAVARALSVHGNPAGSGHALQEMQNYASNQLFGRLGQEKDRLAGFGGLSQYNAAAPAANTNAVNATAGQYNAVGYGLSQAFNPMPTLDQYFRRAMGGSGVLLT